MNYAIFLVRSLPRGRDASQGCFPPVADSSSVVARCRAFYFDVSGANQCASVTLEGERVDEDERRS